MRKIHVFPDENLGGVLREFVEVDRAANVGDKIVIVNPHISQFGDNYTKGTIMTVAGVDGEGDIYCGKFGLIDEKEYKTLEPTDIVHVDGQRYRLVDRKAKVGEKVIVVDAHINHGSYKNGDIFIVHEVRHSVIFVTVDSGRYIALSHFEYNVLDPVESAEETDDVLTVDESETSKSVLDLLANLARRVTELERKLDRLGNANEQAITAVARDVETLAQELEDVKQRTKNETMTLNLDSQTVSKLITEVLLSAQANQNRNNR